MLKDNRYNSIPVLSRLSEDEALLIITYRACPDLVKIDIREIALTFALRAVAEAKSQDNVVVLTDSLPRFKTK